MFELSTAHHKLTHALSRSAEQPKSVLDSNFHMFETCFGVFRSPDALGQLHVLPPLFNKVEKSGTPPPPQGVRTLGSGTPCSVKLQSS